MIVAVASGKGGTGKTTVSVNLARAIDKEILLLDCDVEEPNAHIFIQGKPIKQHTVNVPIPKVKEDLCKECGECAKICEFNAIVSFNTVPLIFPELCHSCGGCIKVCPEKALFEIDNPIGELRFYKNGKISLIEGRLKIAHPMAPPLIKSLKKHIDPQKLVILDAPPGTSCPVIATLKGSNFIILVTEPTPFGLNDLKLAVETVLELDIPFGVIINKNEPGKSIIDEYCQEKNIPILIKIPNQRRIAEHYSKGKILVDVAPEYKNLFIDLWQQVQKLAKNSTL
ncbi:MAG: ATP-binding protein [Desulfonauticus sp.]|nr:ATP-binding protein [Desulfonauticus sp.]